MSNPKYFVLASDGNLYGYDREDILLCDIAEHKRSDDPHLLLFRLDGTLPVRYVPIIVEDLEEAEATGAER